MSKVKEATPKQKEIIDCPSSLVVMAKPGSGKTFTISEKIKNILKEIPVFKGVIAISYTNKASDELKQRIMSPGIKKKGSFFGTMSSFYLNEIIYPFAAHIFGMPVAEIKVYGNEEETEEIINVRKSLSKKDIEKLDEEEITILGDLYIKGIILLETIDTLAVYIWDNSSACKNYLKAKYTHIIIDEFQDCGKMQYEMFARLVKAGLIGIAVGDKDQSIYGFSGKSADYLLRLVSSVEFKPFYLDKNFRCHQSISDYSLRLLNPAYVMNDEIEKRVFKRRITGAESEIVQFIEKCIPNIKGRFNLVDNNNFAILVPSNTYGEVISKSMSIKHKYFKKTALDDDSSLWAAVFKMLLTNIQNESLNIYELCENYCDIEENQVLFNKLYREVECIYYNFRSVSSETVLDAFCKVAEWIYPKAYNKATTDNLLSILKDADSMAAFAPANTDEVQIMTLHKSKGLEFKVVFHLGLYKYILPKEGYDYQGNWCYTEYEQNLNLHYVGVTRAEEMCMLLTSTLRHNGSGDLKPGVESEFLSINGLDNYQA